MTKEGERKLTAAFETTFGELEQAIEQVPALLGAYIDGQKFIVVTDQPDYVWCRIGGNESRRVKAFNQHAGGVAQHFDLPIIIVKDKLNSNVWKVIGRDITRYPDWGQVANYPYSSPYIAHHGADHSFSSQAGMGADPVWVFKRQMMPLLPHPVVSGTMGIEIGSDFYYFNGNYRWFASTGTVDFTPALPTGAVNGRFMTIYIDGTTGNPAYITGTEFNAVIPPIDPGDYISIPTQAQGVAVAAVFLLTGTARIGWGEIYDLRHPHVAVPGTGSLHGVFDEGVLQGQVGTWNFEGLEFSVAVTGSTAHVRHVPSAGGSADHGGLTGLSDDDHGQYLNLPGDRLPARQFISGSISVESAIFGDNTLSSASGTVHIRSGPDAVSVNPNPNADELVIEGAGNAGFSIITPFADNAYMAIGNPTDGPLLASYVFAQGSRVWTWNIDGSEIYRLTTAEVAINDPGENVNFRAETQNRTHGFFVNASTERVGVNTALPQADFHVSGTFLANELSGFGNDVRVTGSVFLGGDLDIHGDAQASGSFTTARFIDTLDQLTTPSPAASGYSRWYSQSGTAYFQTLGGAIFDLTATGSAGGGGVSDVLGFSGGAAMVPKGTTEYIGFGTAGHTTTEANQEFYIPIAGTIRNLRVFISANASDNAGNILTIRLNQAATSLTVTYAAGETGLKSDLSNSFTVAVGDTIAIEFVNTATGGGQKNIVIETVSIELAA